MPNRTSNGPLTLSAMLLAVLSTGVAAQTPITLPSKASSEPGNAAVPLFFSTIARPPLVHNEARTQLLYATDDVGVAQATFRAMQVRMPTNPASQNGPMTIDVRVSLSLSNQPVAASSPDFAGNRGPNPAVVHDGPINLPARPAQGWPALWESPIAFTTPFVFDRSAGRTLVVEIEVRNGTSIGSWHVEGYRTDHGIGMVDHQQGGCEHSGSRTSRTFMPTDVSVGNVFQFGYDDYPCGKAQFANSVGVIGAQGVGGTFAGLLLPFPLERLGMPAAPACQIAVDIVAAVPMSYVTVPSSLTRCALVSPAIRIPGVPSLADGVFYTQAFSLDFDPVSGAPTVFPSLSNVWRIGDGVPVPAATVQRLGNNANPSGQRILERAVTLRFL